MNHSESNLNKLFNQCYILVPDLDNSLSKGLFWPLPLLFRGTGLSSWCGHGLSTPARQFARGPYVQDLCDAAPTINVAPLPSSQRPYSVACVAVLCIQYRVFWTRWLSMGQLCCMSWKCMCTKSTGWTWPLHPVLCPWTQERKRYWEVLERRSSWEDKCWDVLQTEVFVASGQG